MRLLTLLLCAGLSLMAAPRHVIVISLDGFPAASLRSSDVVAPHLREMIRTGVNAPAGMVPINPTVTWPNHTSMVTGVAADRHGMLYNGLPVIAPDSFHIDAQAPKTTLVLAPTVYDLAHERGMKTAEIDWVAVMKAPTIDYSFAEVPNVGDRIPQEMVAKGIMDQDHVARFGKLPIIYRDYIWAEAAIHILKEHKPDLLLLHFLTTDSVQHRHGPRSMAGDTALAYVDSLVGRIVDAVREMGQLENTTFLVVSDHGFHMTRKVIRPAVVLKQKGITGVQVVPEGGTAMIYGKVDPSVFQGIEGIASVITPDQFAKYGYPAAGGRMSDLVLAAADGYLFSGAPKSPSGDPKGPNVVDTLDNPGGSHGYLNTHPDMRQIFIAWGAGVKKGTQIDGVHVYDIAPTIAEILGFEMKNVVGKPLRDIFAK